MASCNPLPIGGYDDNIFLDPPKESNGFHCPICMLVLREPHLLSCCGKHVCEVCIHRVKCIGTQCPCCREEQFITVLNKEKKGKILGLKSYCANKASGCNWTGELGDAKRHLETKCDYIEDECPFGCGQKLPRHALQMHKTQKCSKRPLEVQLECLTEEMMTRLTTLETKYEDKISKIEQKLKEQEKIINEQDWKLKEQEERLVEQKKILKDKLMQQEEKFINEHAVIPVAKEELECIKTLHSFLDIKCDLKENGMHMQIDENGISIRTAQDMKVFEARTRLSSLVSSVQRKVIRVPAERRELLKHMFETKEGQAIVARLEKRYSVKFIVDKFKADHHQDCVDVGILGSDKDSAAKELLVFLRNENVTNSVPYLNPNLQLHFQKFEAFAQSRSVRVVKYVMCFLISGGSYNVQVVKDYYEKQRIDFFKLIQSQ